MKYIILGILFITFVGCYDRNSNREIELYRIKGTELAYDRELLFSKGITFLPDSMLIIRDLENNKYYKLFKINNINDSLSYITSFGYNDKGPSGLLSPSEIQIINNKIIGIYDFNRLRYNYYYINDDLGKVKNQNDLLSHHYIDLSDLEHLSSALQINDSTWFGYSMTSDSRFVLKSKDKKLLPLKIPFPDDKIECSNIQKSLVYQGQYEKHPREDLVVFASNVGDILEIYSLSESTPVIASIINAFPKYNVDSKSSINLASSNYSSDNLNGYNQICVTENHIFALYNGRSPKELGDKKYFANIIRVYDWAGNHFAEIILDRDIKFFSVDIKNNYIYGLSTDLKNYEEKILRFNLPSELEEKL